MKLFIMLFAAMTVTAGVAFAEMSCDKLADGQKGQVDCSKLAPAAKAKCEKDNATKKITQSDVT